MNYLCDVILEKYDKLPTIDKIKKAWSIVVEEERSDALKDISQLSLSQRKVSRFIATHDVSNILSQETCAKIILPSSTISSAVEALIEKDIIEIDNIRNYKIINPVIITVLQE